MSGKDKLRKFRENESFSCLLQPATAEVLGTDYRLKGRWGKEFFRNDNPIVLELGCGKGEYTVGLAEMNPGTNYIGMDIKGARLWKGAKYVHENSVPNAAFLRTRIEFIDSVFAPGEISGIWITFADPQIGRERKRLTSPLFLERYRRVMDGNGIVHLKTDSKYLYSYTKALAVQNGLEILADTEDLYGERDDVGKELSIKTFYESHYLKMGMPINYMAFRIGDVPLKSPQWDGSALAAEHVRIKF
ncbi:MAG: tRNA (guanosine(46)-N7)-methyltransferase TrmB [Bacteroidetes bacterium]|uniref:tRNA (guanine(46)-N(7))-methyltransferase n=1 Tax=Candidatus Merdivivens pullistercoris TaxID=2840873 RepID=A0A9D9N944_9BACT|nr:tRNA (guanosine(46)-N7)-methyltransferase TrmB [Candidatus Merdivivens pullistercoris]